MATCSPIEAAESLWYLDFAVATHMTLEEGILSSLTPYASSNQVEVGNGSLLPVANVGSLTIRTLSNPLSLNNVLRVPKLKHNLLSIQCLCRDNNCQVEFNSSCFSVKENL